MRVRIQGEKMTVFSVKNWRAVMGLSRKQAAEKLGVSPHTIKSYELLQRDLPAPLERLMRKMEREKNGPLGSIPGSSIRIFGGGTLLPVKQDLALTAISYGNTSKAILALCQAHDKNAELQLTWFADPTSSIHTLNDVEGVARGYIADPQTKIVFWNPTMVEYPDHTLFLTNEDGDPVLSSPLPDPQRIPRFIKDKRPDIFLVVFQTTSGLTVEEQKDNALVLLKKTGANMVFAKDTSTEWNMVVTAEQSVYHQTTDKEVALAGLVEMALHRSQTQWLRSVLLSQSPPQLPQEAACVFDEISEFCVVENIPLQSLVVRKENGWVCSQFERFICSEKSVALKKGENGEWSSTGGRPHALGLSVAHMANLDWEIVVLIKGRAHPNVDAHLMDRSGADFAAFLAENLSEHCTPLVLDNAEVYITSTVANLPKLFKALKTFAKE